MQRIEYIDNLRGFAIFLVLLGHIFIAKAPGGTHYPFCEMIYSFHMSLFFFISGYLVYKTNKIREKGTKQYISKKTISLLTPYILVVHSSVFYKKFFSLLSYRCCGKIQLCSKLKLLVLTFVIYILYWLSFLFKDLLEAIQQYS